MESIRRLMVLVLLLIPASLSGQEYSSEPFMVEGRVVVEGLQVDDIHAVRIMDVTNLETGLTVRSGAGGPILPLQDPDPLVLCFEIDLVSNDAPESILGLAYCYLRDLDADTVIQIDGQGIVIGPLLSRVFRIVPTRRS